MSAIGSILSVVGTVVALVDPPAAPFIAILEKIEPYAEAGIPILKAAITEGPAAYAAAKTAAPDFFSQLQNLADLAKAKMSGDPGAVASDHEVANLGAHIVGVDPPGWTHEETQRWWDRASGGG